MSREKYTFSNDWFDYNIELWNTYFSELRKQENQILEIGSFEGASTTWLLDELANTPGSTVTAVDTFGSHDQGDNSGPISELELRFQENVQKSANFAKLRVRKGLSRRVLRSMSNDFEEYFNFIYVDGSHRARDVLDDAVLGWPMLKIGGFMVFDDYRWHKYKGDYDNPKLAIDSFMGCYATEIDVVHRDYQVILRKHPRTVDAIPYDGSFIRDLD